MYKTITLDRVKFKTMLMEVFSTYIAICEANDLRYFCIGGTLIGAVRHQGMIPWDDDIDVAMPRSDYNRFIALTIDKDSPYEIVTMENNSSYYLPYTKFCSRNNTLLEHAHIPCLLGLFIDIFPLDGTSGDFNIIQQELRTFKRQANKLHIQPKRWQQNFITGFSRLFKGQLRTAYNEFSLIFGKKKKRVILTKKLKTLMTKYEYNDAEIVGNYGGMWGIKEFWPKQWFNTYTELLFEGMRVRVPAEYHKILMQVYGDYMQLPPVEKQVTHHHVAFIDLDRRYAIDEVLDIINRKG